MSVIMDIVYDSIYIYSIYGKIKRDDWKFYI